MAKNLSNRKVNIKNIRSKALNTTRSVQGLNKQVTRLDDGQKVRLSQKEIRTMKKAA